MRKFNTHITYAGVQAHIHMYTQICQHCSSCIPWCWNGVPHGWWRVWRWWRFQSSPNLECASGHDDNLPPAKEEHIYVHSLTHTHAHTDTHTQTDRQTDRQTHTHTHTHNIVHLSQHSPVVVYTGQWNHHLMCPSHTQQIAVDRAQETVQWRWTSHSTPD